MRNSNRGTEAGQPRVTCAPAAGVGQVLLLKETGITELAAVPDLSDLLLYHLIKLKKGNRRLPSSQAGVSGKGAGSNHAFPPRSAL